MSTETTGKPSDKHPYFRLTEERATKGSASQMIAAEADMRKQKTLRLRSLRLVKEASDAEAAALVVPAPKRQRAPKTN